MTKAEAILMRIVRGVISCRQEGETPRAVMISMTLREALREQCHQPATEADKAYGVPVQWCTPRAGFPDMAIRTMGGDTRVIH